MATTMRRSAPALIDQLLAEPWRFEFFQAVRLLERDAAQRDAAQRGAAQRGAAQRDRQVLKPVAQGTSPDTELIRFSAGHQLGFAAAEIASVEREAGSTAAAGGQWLMQVQLMALTGSTGVLPYHYSELLQQRSRARDYTLRHFFDLFNHRSVSLYYQAWQKYRPTIARERHHNQARRGADPVTAVLESLIGFGTGQLAERSPIPVASLIGHGGYLGRLVKSAAGLKSTLKQFLGLEVDIEQFRGEWYELPDDLRTSLPRAGREGMNHQLGANMVLGRRSWQLQNRFRVRIHNLNYAQLMSLSPDTSLMRSLKALVQMAAGTEQDFDIALSIDPGDIPAARLSQSPDHRPLLGWNTCLGNARHSRKKIDVVVSQRQF